MSDLRTSIRQLLKTPGFTLAAIGVLAIGIGLNAAMFSVVHAIAFASRPFPEPERLVQLYSRDDRSGDYRAFSYPVYQELAARADVFGSVLAHNPTIVGIGEGTESRRTFSVVVSANYFDVLAVPLLQGRGFTAEESRPGQDIPVVVATYSHWQRTGFDPSFVGKTIRVNERQFTVVGITPRGFTGTMSVFGPELFFPLGVFHSLANDFQGETTRTLARTDAYNLFLVARLRDGVSSAAASDSVLALGQGLARSFPAEHEHQGLSLSELPKFGTSTSPRDESVMTTFGLVLLGMTSAVLLVVCLNLASMLLARGRGRRREFAIRLALGSSRGRLVRQLLTEGVLLSIVGGALGIALGGYGVKSLLTSLTMLLPITIVLDTAMSPALLGATAFFCLLATLAFALGPALKHSRADILSDLKAQTGDEPAPRRWRFIPRNPLVAAQVALSLSLLIAAGLFLRMAVGALLVDLGYRADDTVLAEVDGRLGGMDEARALDTYARLEERLGALPGVQSASIGALVPLGTISISKHVQRAGVRPAPGSEPATPEAGRGFDTPWNPVGAAYFDAMGIRLQQGRPFTTAEAFGKGAPRVAIIDETLARRLWPDGDALGQGIQWAPEPEDPSSGVPIEVVGIVAPTQRDFFENNPRGGVYVPFAQGFTSNAYFHVRPTAPSTTLVDAVRREIRTVASTVPLFSVRTFKDHVRGSAEYWALTMSASLFAFFGGVAMVIALVGLYAVTAHAVARRTREIGVRMAIGANPANVLRMILGESLATTLGGVLVGWLMGIGVGRIMGSMFVDVSPFDPWTFVLMPFGFIVAAVAATLVPARRATAINPVTAMRSE